MNKSSAIPLAAWGGSRKLQGAKLLVVDDLPDNLFLIRHILDADGYRVLEASNGEDAIAMVNADPPDLILLDVMMPDVDGYEVTKRLRSQVNLPYIPILLITAFDRPSVSQGLDLGADDFIRKPVNSDELLARARSLLRLKFSLEERDRIARQREDFVSRLTHDLRTPLVAADRMLGLLQEGAIGEISPQVLEMLAVMTRSNSNLLEMVNKLLEVYRYEDGNKTLAMQPLDLAELVQQVVQELSPIALTKNLALSTDIPMGMPAILGDRLELRRVFSNLIGNAIKFTEVGKVHVSLEQNKSHLIVHIIDTGFGIPATEHPFLFQRFHQGSHQKPGSGLGLYLSNYIAIAHGGNISLECLKGEGCRFSVHLPYDLSQ